MAVSVQLIVLNLTKTGERNLVLHTLSPQYGRRSFLVTPGTKMPSALFQPLSLLDAEAVENPKSDLWRLRSVSAQAPLLGLRSNVGKSAVCMFISEVLWRTIKDGCCEPGLYEWCRGRILTLDALESDWSNFHMRFLLEFASALGFGPSYEDLLPFAGQYASVIRDLLTLDFGHTMLLELNGKTRSAVAGVLLDYISHHTDTHTEVKSLAVLEELFR